MKKRIITILIALMLAVSIILPVSAAEPAEGYYHYVGPWIWDTVKYGGSWQMPPGAFQAIDLRSIPEMSQRGGTPGFGFFISSVEITLPGYRAVGRKFADNFPQAVRTLLQNRYSISLPPADIYTTRGLIWSLFVELADPTGDTRWKPLQPRIDGMLVIHLEGYSPVEFWKDPPRESPGWGNCWKGKWGLKWDARSHHWFKSWQYYKMPRWIGHGGRYES